MPAVLATEVPPRGGSTTMVARDRRVDAFCARCGTPLRTASARDNEAPHGCDGNYEWLDGVRLEPKPS